MTKQDILQNKVIEKCLEYYKTNNIGHLNLAMRFGKTLTAISWLKKQFNYNCTILIAYPDNKLKENWQKELILWKYNNPNIEYVNFSSLKKHINYLYNKYDVFLIDEWHSLSEKELELAKQVSNNSTITLALSGTISKETQESWKELKEIDKYTTLDGIRDQILSDYTVSVHLVNLDNKIKTINKSGKEKTEKQKYDGYTWIIKKNQREGKDFMHLALARNRLSLSSIGKIEYTKKLLNSPAKLANKRTIVFTGLSDVADNLNIPSHHSKSPNSNGFIDFMENKTKHLALAAMGKVGVTYTNLDSVILLNFTYNKEESSQILNRAIKLDYSGKIADLHVICLNEEPEIKKVKESLSMLDISKIKYV